jgi:nitrate/nitrite-specific signal transduction histidine kinase
VPIQYNDEIGSLTGSFNTLTQSLEKSYDSLEQRIADRTRELSAFSDLTRLSTEDDDLAGMLEPALARVMETTGCHAIALHLLKEEDGTLELFAERNIDRAALSGLKTISPAFVKRLLQAESPLVTDTSLTQTELPRANDARPMDVCRMPSGCRRLVTRLAQLLPQRQRCHQLK